MSSPSSRLKKVKRSPLPPANKVPFRQTPTARGKEIPPPPSDSELLGSMAARLAQAESQLQTARREVREKEARIRELEARLVSASPAPSDKLQRRCEALQRQVQEMEEFLNDYGMIWVGGETATEPNKGVGLSESPLPHNPFRVDFDLIGRNVKSLNILAGEDSTAVSTTPRGATLKSVEAVPLTLFANGIVMFQGPFRPYSDPQTQQCVQDLMDGYFPSELQPQFPDGVPLALTDRREVTFAPQRAAQIFPGSGQKLGKSSSSHVTSDLPGPKLSVNQFLSRLPASVVKGGRVIDIRSEVSATLTGSSPPQPSSLTLLHTPALEHIRSRPASSSMTTLKVRSESGDHTYLLKMRAEDTISDVWSHILSQTPPTLLPSTCSYQLVGGVTHEVYSDPLASLADCGLVPSGTLYITKTTSGFHR